MPSPIDVQKSLAGTDYPARKDELIARAKDNGASGEVMDALQKLPDREYDGPSGVQKEIF
jgi:Protein of unknown function (DUF2795)